MSGTSGNDRFWLEIAGAFLKIGAMRRKEVVPTEAGALTAAALAHICRSGEQR